jgi:hypothetical protein
MHNFFTDKLGYKLIQRTKSARQMIKLCFSLFSLIFILATTSNVALSETLECEITHRFINERLELQKKWMPDKTVHTLEATNGTKIIAPASIKMDGKLRRNKTTNRIKLAYRFKMDRPDIVNVDYVYQPSKGILKVYSMTNTDLLKLHGQVASGTCREIKLAKPKAVVKPKLAKITKPKAKPAYISGTTLTSLHINFKNAQLVDFMCELEAIFHNVRTKQNTIIPFFPNVDGLGHSILTTDIEDSFDNSLPKLDNLTIKIQSSTGSSCKPAGLSYLSLVDNSFNKLIKINQNGRIEIPNFEIKNLQ